MKTPRLYILCGLPFSGKTTLAKKLEKRLGFVLIDIDVNQHQWLLDYFA